MHTVCHLTSVHPPFDIRIFHKQCISLAENGFKVNLVAPVNKMAEMSGVNVFPVKLPKSRLKRMLVVSSRMRKVALQTKSELFHFHDPELLFCGILLKLSGKKVIFDIHENIRLSFASKSWLPNWLVPFIRLFYFIFERFAILFFDALVLAEDSYQAYYPFKKSVVVLNYPIPEKVEMDKQIAERSSIIRLIYVGGVSENRGIWEMLQLALVLTTRGIGFKLTIVGKIYSNELKQRLKDFISNNKLQRTVNIVGMVPFENVKDYLVKADIGLAILKPIANYKASLPTKLFEYMQFGLPVITNNFPLYKKYIEVENSGLCIDVNQFNEEIEKILSLLGNRALSRQMGENGQKVILKYNWYSEEKKLIKLYKQLLD